MSLKLQLVRNDIEKLKAGDKLILDSAAEGVDRAALHLESVVKRRFNRPGELQTRTGLLLRSVRTSPAKIKSHTIEAIIGSPLIYAAIHEFGGRSGRNHATEIPPRPYFSTSYERAKWRMRFLIEDSIKLKGGV